MDGTGGLLTAVPYAHSVLSPEASVQLGVVRDGAPFAVTAPMLPSDGLGTTRVLGWAGLLLQETGVNRLCSHLEL